MKAIFNVIEKFSWAFLITTLMSMDFMVSLRDDSKNLMDKANDLTNKISIIFSDHWDHFIFNFSDYKNIVGVVNDLLSYLT